MVTERAGLCWLGPSLAASRGGGRPGCRPGTAFAGGKAPAMGWAAISLTSPRDREAKRQLWWPLAEGLSGTSSRAGGAGAPEHTGQQSGQWAPSEQGARPQFWWGALFTERLTWQTHPLP